VEQPTVIQTSASETIVEHPHVVEPVVQHADAVNAPVVNAAAGPTRIGPLVQQ